MKNTKNAIELSTVYFYDGAAPRVLALGDCGLAFSSDVPGIFAGWYGYRAKGEGYVAAATYAEEHRLKFTVIDLLVQLDQPINTNQMKPDELEHHDFVSFFRMTRPLLDEVGEILSPKITGRPYDAAGASNPRQLFLDHPEAIVHLTADPRWKHLKVIAYDAALETSTRPIRIGVVPVTHWKAIREATCRLDPTVRITLDPPKPSAKLKPSVAPVKERARSKLK